MTQPTIDGTGHGIPRMIYGSDGSKWYAVYVDSAGLQRVASKSGDKIFGFESIVEEALSDTALPTGYSILVGTAVPAGKIWKITQLSIQYVGTVTNVEHAVSAAGLATSLALLHVRPPVSATWYPWSGEIYLQVGDYLRIEITGATSNDDVYFRYAGVQMNAP